MTTKSHQRRLAAIVAADIANYSALMGADEEGTVAALKEHQSAILPLITKHSGRLIDTAGDGILAEFASVLKAVECAIEIQRVMAERNSDISFDKRMKFRIGINLGDVIFDDAKVYGDGVNISARLEALSDPGGICISGTVKDHIGNRLPVQLIDLGTQSLKNIASPVDVYKIVMGEAQPTVTPKSALSLPDKPSIAVLPFTNMSADPEQEYFSDGITEDILTELSRFSELFVIARNSSFQYKGKSPDIRQVGRELGVRYVLEGSIRRAGDRVRITAQLIDASTGTHKWAERYDRSLDDVFAIQDELARTLATVLVAHVNKAEIENASLRPPSSWQAHDYYLRASELMAHFAKAFDVSILYSARDALQQSLDIDPRYSRAHALLSFTWTSVYKNPLDKDYLQPGALQTALNTAENAVQTDGGSAQAHSQLGFVLMWMKEYDRALREFQVAKRLNPNYHDFRYAACLVVSGLHERAVEAAQDYIRLDPYFHPMGSAFLGQALFFLKRHSEAVSHLDDFVCRSSASVYAHCYVAANFAYLGRMTEAKRACAHALQLLPKCDIETVNSMWVYRNEEDFAYFITGMRMAGFPL